MRPSHRSGGEGLAAPSLSTSTTLVIALLGVLLLGCATRPVPPSQAADHGWRPTLAEADFPPGSGPVVLVDAAHGNFHTAEGRFKAFADLLTANGYTVRSSTSEITLDALAEARVFVIANPVLGGSEAEWVLPTPSAFETSEVDALDAWVRGGGSLLLIADHMPFPGAAVEVADVFGFGFLNGFAMKSVAAGGTLHFERDAAPTGDVGRLADHPITRAREGRARIESVKSYTGQGFRIPADATALMTLPDDWEVLLPQEAWEFDEATERVSAGGLSQGAIRHHGEGRVAAFGEAAMFTAQTATRGDTVFRFGLNDPDAPHNARFVLNVLRWLDGALEDTPDADTAQ